jgi:hypothetical protein
MSNQKEPWELEARHRSDARDRLSHRDSDVNACLVKNDVPADVGASRDFQSAGASPSFPTTESGTRVSLKDAAAKLRDTASLRPDHPERVKALADYAAAKSRGDSTETRSDARTNRHDQHDERRYVKLADGRCVSPELAADFLNRGDSVIPADVLRQCPAGRRPVPNIEFGGWSFVPLNGRADSSDQRVTRHS